MERKHPLAECEKCPFGQLGGFVPTLNPHPSGKIAVIGEAPGAYEAAYKIPFTGPSGDLLNQVLHHHDINREDIMISNVCLCRPKENEDPPKSAIAACSGRLHRELAESGVDTIIAVGKAAAHELLDDKTTMRKMRIGPKKPYKFDHNIGVVATWHPAYCLRTPDAFPDLVSDIGKVKKDVLNDWIEPQYRVYDDPANAERVIRELGSRFERFVLDIECGAEKDSSFIHPSDWPLLCLGIAFSSKQAVVLGENAINHPRVGAVLREILPRVKLVAHNGKFDLAGLRNVAGPQKLWFDTMLASYSLNERPGHHGLKPLSIEKLGAPDYEQAIRKYIPRSGNYADIPRAVLYKYNAYDVVCTWDLMEQFEQEMLPIDRRKHNFLVDAANVLIDLDTAGLTFDVEYNKELHVRFEEELHDIELKMKEIIGRDINPRSVPQVQAYYKDQNLILPTTNADFLKELSEVIDGEPLAFTEQLLLHRRRAKLFGTYVKGLAKRVYKDKVYTTYLLHGTTSGRLSSRDPNLQNICFSDDTEILTDNGWKLFSKLNKTELVAQWSGDGTIKFVQPEEYIEKEYEGTMIHATAQGMNLLMTPEHRALSLQRNGKLVIEQAKTWLKYGNYDKLVYRKLVRGGIKIGGHKLTEQEKISLEKAIAFQADGTWKIDWKNKCSIRVTSIRKRQQLAKLFENEVRHYKNCDTIVLEHSDFDLNLWLNLPEKTFKPSKIIDLDFESLEFFLKCIMRWDGDFTREMTYLQHEDRKLSVDVVQIAALLTNKSTLWYQKSQEYHTVNIHRLPARWFSYTNIKEVSYIGKVYCVNVPSGFIVVRRNGMALVSGNCREKYIRNQFTAENSDNVLVQLDFKQAEGRVIATLAQEEYLRNIFADPDRDLFNEMCDDIFGKQKWNKENRVAMKSIFYGCVPLNVKILTRRGWLKHDQVIAGEDETIGYDQILGKSRWTKITDVVRYDNVETTKFYSSNIAFETTANHRWYGQNRRSINGKRFWKNEFFTTDSIKHDTRIMLGAEFDSDTKLNITDQEAAILGWAYSDGSVKMSELSGITGQGRDGRRRQTIVNICQDKKSPFVKDIDRLLVGYKHFRYEYENNNQVWWKLPSAVGRDLLTRANLIDTNKPITFALTMSNSQRKSFFDSVIKAEGNKYEARKIAQSEGWLNEVIKIIGYLNGFLVKTYKDDSSLTQIKDHYKYWLARPILTGQEIRKTSGGKKDVWCVKTELGTWTMHQNGLTVLTGNSAYGRGALSITKELNLQGLTITEHETRTLMSEFNSLIPNVKTWQKEIRRRVLNGEDLITPYGRRRSFWLITDRNREDVINEALSFLPQSIASDITLTALINVYPKMSGFATMRLSIHDALVFECAKDRVQEASNMVKNEMIKAAEEFTSYVQFAVDVTTGYRWGELG